MQRLLCASGPFCGRANQLVRTLLFFLLLAASWPALAAAQQTGAVTGIVRGAEDGAPLPGANVVLSGTAADVSALGAAADADGRFEIGAVPAGAYVLQISAVGYETVRRDVEVEPGATLEVVVPLNATDVRLRGVEVTALRPDLQPEAGVEARQIRELDPVDTGELMRSLPGIGAARWASTRTCAGWWRRRSARTLTACALFRLARCAWTRR